MSGLQGGLDRVLHAAAHRVSPFYRRYPYRGQLWVSEVDTRAAISRQDKFFFGRVPKAANSTIIANLAQRSATRSGRNLRQGKEKWFFDRPLFASSSTVARIECEFFKFTFVRDPFTRTLSAFLDKVGRRQRQSREFFRWWGKDLQPGFGDFCRYLEEGGLYDDIHWAPQVDILLLPIADFDMIGRFENLQGDLEVALTRIFGDGAAPVMRSGPRADASSALARHYDQTLLAQVGRLYARDMSAFGYGAPDIG